MENHDGELGEFRMALLRAYVEILVHARKLDVLQFVAPPGFGGGDHWGPYRFEDWQKIFGDCIDV